MVGIQVRYLRRALVLGLITFLLARDATSTNLPRKRTSKKLQDDPIEVTQQTIKTLRSFGASLNKNLSAIELLKDSYQTISFPSKLEAGKFVAIKESDQFIVVSVEIVHEETRNGSHGEEVTVQTGAEVRTENGLQRFEKSALIPLDISQDGILGYSSVVEAALRLQNEAVGVEFPQDYIQNGLPNPAHTNPILLSPSVKQLIMEPIILKCRTQTSHEFTYFIEENWVWTSWNDFIQATLNDWIEYTKKLNGIQLQFVSRQTEFPYLLVQNISEPSANYVCDATPADPQTDSEALKLLKQYQDALENVKGRMNDKGISSLTHFQALSLAFKQQYMSYVSRNHEVDDVVMHARENQILCQQNAKNIKMLQQPDIFEMIQVGKQNDNGDDIGAGLAEGFGLLTGLLGVKKQEDDPRLTRLQFLCPGIETVSKQSVSRKRPQHGGFVGFAMDLQNECENVNEKHVKRLPGHFKPGGREQGSQQSRQQQDGCSIM